MLDSPLSRTFASTSIAERDRNDHSLRERAFGDAEAIGFIKKRFNARSAANAATVPKNRQAGGIACQEDGQDYAYDAIDAELQQEGTLPPRANPPRDRAPVEGSHLHDPIVARKTKSSSSDGRGNLYASTIVFLHGELMPTT